MKNSGNSDITYELMILSLEGSKLLTMPLREGRYSVGGGIEADNSCDFTVPSFGDQVFFVEFFAGKLNVFKRNAALGFHNKTLRPGKILELGGHAWLLAKADSCLDQIGNSEVAVIENESLLFRLIHWVSRSMQGKDMLDAALQGYLNMLLQGVKAKGGAIITFDQRGVRIVSSSGLKPEQAESYVKKFPKALLQEIIQNDIRLVLPEELRGETGKDWRTSTIFMRGVAGVAGLPVVAEGKVQAILLVNLASLVSELTEAMQFLLEAAASLLGLVFQRAVLREQIEEFVMHADQNMQGEKSGNRLMIGRSIALDNVYQKLQKYAQISIPVLITGETGTGKELAAREVHRLSLRKNGPFIAFNSAALPENLVEAELFGYRRGAFSGAVSDRAGLIELAAGGTLFIDEIGEMPLTLQAKLLRVLQERQVSRLGASAPREVDFRLVTATHCPIKDLIQKNLFREDFYYRIAGGSVVLPPLRQRSEDIPLLVHFFRARYSHLHQLPHKDFSREAIDFLTRCEWPGNIRQLQHIVESSLIMAEGDVITLADVMMEFDGGDENIQASAQAKPSNDEWHDMTLASAKAKWLRQTLIDTLEKHAWNKSQTARSLGIGLRTLFRYIEQLDIVDRSNESHTMGLPRVMSEPWSGGGTHV